MSIQPLGDRVLVQEIEVKEVSVGGIILPDSAKEKPQEAKVIAIGTGGIDSNGKEITFHVAEGDTVIVSQYGGTPVKADGQEYKILNQNDILAIVK
ncbi:co-chaperone GroES [Lentisphaera profundi]|uniref:Co-chaperonin GroES n=1 Tax=Lentisphaera profundi TaxID=1658616 RepID=A0ABY7VZC0_9BACT|nr:co-chaperone GroES [Lentisphaera profundi]WDE97393.1 co-chaperone GroES [Lentisphaera profundi]